MRKMSSGVWFTIWIVVMVGLAVGAIWGITNSTAKDRSRYLAAQKFISGPPPHVFPSLESMSDYVRENFRGDFVYRAGSIMARVRTPDGKVCLVNPEVHSSFGSPVYLTFNIYSCN